VKDLAETIESKKIFLAVRTAIMTSKTVVACFIYSE
jgi:hypothetical protein